MVGDNVVMEKSLKDSKFGEIWIRTWRCRDGYACVGVWDMRTRRDWMRI